MSQTNKCRLIRETCNWVVQHASNVKIVPDKISCLRELKYTPFNSFECHNAKLDDQKYLTFLFAMDAMNFCFWPNPTIEYDFLAQSVKNAVVDGILTCKSMCEVTEKELVSKAFANQDIPLADERARILNEVGKTTILNFQGSFSQVVRQGQKSAVKLLDILTCHFSNFQDHAIYKGHQIHFYKRAQILVGDIYAHFNGQGLGEFSDISELTMFADYRVPQILRQMGVLEYSEQLSITIDSKKEIPHGGQYQIEIRAATVVAVEMIRSHLSAALDRKVLSVEVDWYLWEQGEKNLQNLKPHHRVMSIYY